MARKRMIDPEFWSDEEIGQWSFSARLFYIGLWNFADDEGRFKAHDSLLKSQIFPYDSKINIENLKKELNHKIQWYESEGLQYGYIRNFTKYQKIDRPSESKLPIPPPFGEHSASPRGLLDTNRSKEKLKEVNINVHFDFESIYNNYPSKIGRKEAERHFKASVKSEVDFFNIKKALENYVASERVKKGIIQNASTWFNNWQDWIDSPITQQTYKCKNCGYVCNVNVSSKPAMSKGLCFDCYNKQITF